VKSDDVAGRTKVYEAIVARDPDRAAEAMREHLEEVEAFYWQVTQAGPG
jgi:DNA-binding FadR family transcriptional regulator